MTLLWKSSWIVCYLKPNSEDTMTNISCHHMLSKVTEQRCGKPWVKMESWTLLWWGQEQHPSSMQEKCQVSGWCLEERLQSVSLVVTTLLTSLQDTTTENLNKGFKVAADSLENITNHTEKILKEVDQILRNLADSPQVIVLITVSGMVSIASILGVLIGIHIKNL